MPATVIESNHTPFRRVDVDPVDLDIIENALRNARHEMDAVLSALPCRPVSVSSTTSFPDRQSRRQDGSRAIRRLHQRVLNSYEGEIHEGDVFLTNDPYSCDGAISTRPIGWCYCRSSRTVA